MKLFRLTLAVLFIVVFALIACNEEPTPTDPADTGGAPPSGTDASNVCSGGNCANSQVLETQCDIFLASCLTYAPEKECVDGAWVICNAAP